MWRRFVQFGTILAAGAALGETATAADKWTTVVEAEPREFHYEAWGGGDGSGRAVSVYGGLTASLGGDIRANGFRLRSSGSYGTYSYVRSYAVANRKAWQEFAGAMWSTDVLIGYQSAVGPWIVKAFIGGAQETHVVRPRGHGSLGFDDENAVQGERWGVKGALETWLNVDNIAFVQTDMSWSSAFKSYGSRLRTGYRLNPAFSTGLEAGVHGNANHDVGRGGAFLRFEWTGGEVSASAGAAGNHHEITGLYGSLAVMIRF